MSDQIDVNQIADVLNNKVDLADGINQANVDYVIESQYPTAQNNYTWYRLYKSGWVEQGGWIQNTTGVGNVVFPVTMSDNKYTISGISDNNSGVAGSFTMIDGNSATTTGFQIIVNFNGNNPATKTIRWKVEGMSAQGGS